MQTAFPTAAAAAAILLAAFTAPAGAEELCSVPDGAEVKSVEEIQAMLEADGYEVARMDREDGCVDMKGHNAGGQRVEVYVDPVSGAIVKVKGES